MTLWIRLVLLPLLVTGAYAAESSGVPLENGRYRIVATIESCESRLCAMINPKGREEKRLTLVPSKWDVGLRSITGLKTVLTGRVRSMELTLEEPPKLFRDRVDDLANPPAPFKKL